MLKEKEIWQNTRLPGTTGLNNFDDPSAIADTDLAGAQNVVFDGFLRPRSGSELLTVKPTGETGDPLQTMEARTSDGVEYLIGVYANHFYLWHPDTLEWVRINQTYVPTETTIRYGYQVWNNGRGDDRLYACNGVDNFARWDICVSTVAGAHTAGATTVTLTDGTRFPAGGGTLILKSSGGTFFTEAYTSRTGNVFTLTNTLDNNVDAGSSATLDMIEKADMELGKIVSKHSGRLMVMNYYGGETVLWYSVLNDPEDFTVGSDVVDAGTETIADGNGGITGGFDFGEFFVITKEDSTHLLRFKIDETLASKLSEIIPLTSGQSLGPISSQATVKVLNKLYYPTRTEGFMSQSPVTTGGQSSVVPEIISGKIHRLATDGVTYDNCTAKFFDQKILWAVGLPGGTQNIQVLMFDTLKNAWSVISGWAVQDFAKIDKKLYYMDSGDGSIYECFNGTYNDNSNPYECIAYTKRFDYEQLAVPKTADGVYLQGYLTSATDLYVDVLYNEGGTFKTQTFLINKDTEGLFYLSPLTGMAGHFTLGSQIAGQVDLEELGDVFFFRCYLGISNREGFFNIQLRFRSNKAAFWGISGMAVNPDLEQIAPAEIFINPTVTN